MPRRRSASARARCCHSTGTLALACRKGYSPPMLTFAIAEPDHCRQLESLLHSLLPAAPAAYRRKLITGRHVLVNGGAAAAETMLVRGDVVTMKESARTRELLTTCPSTSTASTTPTSKP